MVMVLVMMMVMMMMMMTMMMVMMMMMVRRNLSKLLPVVDRDPEDSHKSEQIFSPACQKVPNIRKAPQKMYKNS